MTGYVYFIADGTGLIKIGVTKNMKNRLATLQTASPTKLRKIGVIETEKPYQIEKKLHKRYKKYRMTGEWFRMDERTAKAIIRDETGRTCIHCGNRPYHYFGLSSKWFRENANFARLSKCPDHLAFYHGKPHQETGMEIIEDMPDMHRLYESI